MMDVLGEGGYGDSCCPSPLLGDILIGSEVTGMQPLHLHPLINEILPLVTAPAQHVIHHPHRVEGLPAQRGGGKRGSQKRSFSPSIQVGTSEGRR